MSDKLVTIAALLKEQGYATGQFGKNHLGDLNHMLPTNHGFDEFFGNLYHLNAEEEPEMYNYPSEKDFPNFRKNFGPRGVIHSWATDTDDKTEMPRWGRVGKQKIEDTGPLNTKRMETCDDEFAAAATDFIKRQNRAGKPWFVWLNTTHMHFITHTKKRSLGRAGRWQSPYHDTMIDHDKNVGQMLDLLDQLGVAEDTFVMYSTDNGPHRNYLAGRRHHALPQREEHQLGRRVPRPAAGALAGPHRGRLGRQRDRAAPRLAADLPGDGGCTRRRREIEEGLPGGRANLQESHRWLQPAAVPDRRGEESPRNFFFYFSDDGDVLGLRFDNWKIVFMEQRLEGTMGVWAEPFVRLRLPKIFNLRTDPVRVRQHHVELVLGLADPQRLLHLRGAGGRGEVRRDLQGLPGGPEAGQLHRRRRAWRRWHRPPAEA